MFNAVKHAEAQTVEIRLASSGGHVTLTVRDDGRGFDMRTDGAWSAARMFGPGSHAGRVGRAAEVVIAAHS